MLGIVNCSSLVGMDAIRKNRSSQNGSKCDYQGQHHKKGKQNCLASSKTCNKCGQKNHFKAMCRSSEGLRYESKCESKRQRSDRTSKKCTHRCNVHEINEDCHDDNTGMEDLADQVQSLFSH